MKQEERIKEMELLMDRASAAVMNLSAAIDHRRASKNEFRKKFV